MLPIGVVAVGTTAGAVVGVAEGAAEEGVFDGESSRQAVATTQIRSAMKNRLTRLRCRITGHDPWLRSGGATRS
jgi:hypothetical protein